MIFTLSATQNGKKGIGYSALVVLLPEFKFTESVYTADYPFDGKGPISFKNALHFEGGLKVKAIELSGKYGFKWNTGLFSNCYHETFQIRAILKLSKQLAEYGKSKLSIH